MSVWSTMRTISSFLLFLFLSCNVLGQDYCLFAGPGSYLDSTTGAASITGEDGTGFSVPKDCQGNQGTLHVRDLTASATVKLKKGKTYTLTWGADTCGMAYYKAGRAWIDWEGNGFTNDPHEGEALGPIYSQPATDMWSQNTEFTVPDNCVNGNTRLRVLITEDQDPTKTNPCADFPFGGMTDFGVELTSCSGGGGAGGISGGTIFLILLLVFGFVYIVGGCVFNVKKRGMQPGLDAFPQIEFWRTIPGYTKDGCIWSYHKTKDKIEEMRGGKNYAHVDDI